MSGSAATIDGIPYTPDGLDGVEDYPLLFAELIRRGWSDADLAKLAGGNVLRVLRKAEAVSRVDDRRAAGDGRRCRRRQMSEPSRRCARRSSRSPRCSRIAPCCGAPKTMRGAFVDPGGDLPKLKAAAAAGRGDDREDPADPRPYRPLRHRPACSPRSSACRSRARTRTTCFWIERLAEDGARYGITGKPFEPDRWLDDGDTVTVGELTLDVRHCPGHTPGHVVFHHPESKLAMVGDVLFQGSIGRWDFPHGNQQRPDRSITQRLWPMGDDTAFVPGHGPMSTFGHERATNPFVGDRVLAGARLTCARAALSL